MKTSDFCDAVKARGMQKVLPRPELGMQHHQLHAHTHLALTPPVSPLAVLFALPTPAPPTRPSICSVILPCLQLTCSPVCPQPLSLLSRWAVALLSMVPPQITCFALNRDHKNRLYCMQWPITVSHYFYQEDTDCIKTLALAIINKQDALRRMNQ